MADFTSSFWEFWIIVPTIGGLVFCIWLINWMNESPGAAGQSPQTMGHVWDENLEEYNNPLPRWWLNLFYITIVFAFIYLVCYPGLGSFQGLFGWSSAKAWQAEMADADAEFGPLFEKFAGTPIPQLAGEADAKHAGERLYASYCSTCHGSDARGVRGYPNLRDGDWLWGGEAEKVVETITNGRQGVMPAWGEMLKAEQISDVVEHVLRLSGTPVDTAKADRGKAVFATNCAACHGPEGKGQVAMGAPNLTDEVWLHGGSTARITETIVKGRMGRMPAWGEFLGPAKVHVVAAYVYGLSREGGAEGQEATAQNP